MIVSRAILNYPDVECIEFIVRNGSKFDRRSVGDMPFALSRIIAVKRGNVFLEVVPSLIFETGDRVLVFCLKEEREVVYALI